MVIAVDAMGGDNAPREIVAGVIAAVKAYDVKVILVGQAVVIREELDRQLPGGHPAITIEHAEQVVTMEDIPSQIVRGKRHSSIHVGLKLVKDGAASAFYSAGNTGAVMGTAILTLRTLEGIDRPAIAAALPSLTGRTVLLDVGANVDSKPENYLQFAIMGTAFAKSVLHLNNPRVGLLSIGEEDVKGNDVTKTVFSMLKECDALNFIGNVEAKELYKGKADVVVCDGFVGNIALKTSEAVASFVGAMLKEEIGRSLLGRAGALLMLPALKRLMKRANYEEYGGAPLLGVNGVCIIGHGSSSANAVKNAIRVTTEMVDHSMNQFIKDDINNSLELINSNKSAFARAGDKVRKLTKSITGDK